MVSSTLSMASGRAVTVHHSLGSGSRLQAIYRLGQGKLMKLSHRNNTIAVSALGNKGEEPRKGLKREDEPEEYWSSERERKGESPFKDPVALIGILAILFPFILLIILSAAGIVDLTPQ